MKFDYRKSSPKKNKFSVLNYNNNLYNFKIFSMYAIEDYLLLKFCKQSRYTLCNRKIENYE